MRWTAVVNPAAGRGRTRRLLPELRRALATHDVAVHVGTSPTDAMRAARDAYGRGFGVVACGGDGTIAAIAGVAAEHGGPLAVIPTGAGNDFARQFGLDVRRPLQAIDLLDGGEVLDIDLGRASAADGTTRAFTTVANTGFDSEANRWANDVRWARGSTLYLVSIARTLARYRPQPVIVRVDAHEWRGEAWLVAIGNTRWYAGGLMITPDAEVDDGLLDVCVIEATSTAKFVARFPTVFRGRHTRVDEVMMLRGREIEVLADSGGLALDLWASGERVGTLPAMVTVAPRALRVLVPRAATDRAAT